MKKRLLFVVLLAAMLLAGTAAKAQPKAIGVRFGWVAELSYQHTLGPGFLEFGFGVPGYNAGIALDGIYNWVAYKNTTSTKDRFEFFVGAGVGLHTYFYRGGYHYDRYGNYYYVDEGGSAGLGVGILGSIGVQYQFSIPLQIGLSWRPMFGGYFASNDSRFYLPGLYDAGLAIRYVF